MHYLEAAFWIVLAIIAITFIGVAVSQRWLFRHVIGEPPDSVLVPCDNCGEWLRGTMNGPIHVKAGGPYCDQLVARPKYPPHHRTWSEVTGRRSL